jgi:hypothetical protein
MRPIRANPVPEIPSLISTVAGVPSALVPRVAVWEL